jgi:hypothetical protein
MRTIWILLAIAPISPILFNPLPTQAQQGRYLCYMRDSDGQIIDLSASVCGAGKSKPPDSTTPQTSPSTTTPAPATTGNRNDTFWDAFGKALSDPAAMQTVNALGRSTITDMGQGACDALKNGQSLPDPKSQALETRYPASFFDAVNTAAVNSLCPELKPKPKTP